jgi:hypothetical protein
MNTKSQLSMPSFVGGASGQSSPPLCFTPPAKVDKNIDQPMLCCCRKAPRSQCLAAIGEYCTQHNVISNQRDKINVLNLFRRCLIFKLLPIFSRSLFLYRFSIHQQISINSQSSLNYPLTEREFPEIYLLL